MPKELVIRSDGADLLDNSGRVVWTSAGDSLFRNTFVNELSEDDADTILEYLVEREVLSDDEADEVECVLDEGSDDDDEDDADFEEHEKFPNAHRHVLDDEDDEDDEED